MQKINIKKLYTPEQITKTIPTKQYKTKYVNTEITMKACKECPNYSKNWACPQFKEDIYKIWDKYENIKLYLTKINYTKEAQQTKYTPEELEYITQNTLFKERNKLIQTLEHEEQKHKGTYLSAGYCTYCQECTRIQQKPCRHPDKCHNSIESIGGLVKDTLENIFNEKLKWIDTQKGQLPENLSLLMALLY
ncbi:MAG: hypothetical protein BZ138_00465 [Methanosphaera sp. rholeuAM270]|nr:MAG: hypothetical protein BZ138_00465 [Methanosphaera sp. rholeuAM270]